MDVRRYFWYTCLCTTFLWPLRFGWLLVLSLYKEDYLQIFKCVSFWYHGRCVSWEGWDPVNRFNHTSWMAIVTRTVCNRSFCWRFCAVTLFLDFFCGCRGFCHRNESDFFLFPRRTVYTCILDRPSWYYLAHSIQILRALIEFVRALIELVCTLILNYTWINLCASNSFSESSWLIRKLIRTLNIWVLLIWWELFCQLHFVFYRAVCPLHKYTLLKIIEGTEVWCQTKSTKYVSQYFWFQVS